MITIVLTLRNRNPDLVVQCLLSLSKQRNKEFKVILVDYGSKNNHFENLKERLHIQNFPFLRLIRCEVEKQLWCKSRAVNIAVRQTENPWIFIGDVDMVYHPNFVTVLYSLIEERRPFYFKVAYMPPGEAEQEINFEDLKTSHESTEEATGMTLLLREQFLSINGMDEFYHGWGSEDTDLHLRLKHIGLKPSYYDKEILIKHQWHKRQYRSKNNLYPFHTRLEKFNHQYLANRRKYPQGLANLKCDWGEKPENVEKNTDNYERITFEISNSKEELQGLLFFMRELDRELMVKVILTNAARTNKLKNGIKKLLNRNCKTFYNLEEANNRILEEIIKEYRHLPYRYCCNWNNGSILWTQVIK